VLPWSGQHQPGFGNDHIELGGDGIEVPRVTDAVGGIIGTNNGPAGGVECLLKIGSEVLNGGIAGSG
jgi:hypothetical protein